MSCQISKNDKIVNRQTHRLQSFGFIAGPRMGNFTEGKVQNWGRFFIVRIVRPPLYYIDIKIISIFTAND